MAKREFDLMGYIGEAIVEQWLLWKYPPSDYDVISQFIPSDLSTKGGGYLDFGVTQNGKTIEVYEVKSQDYIPDNEFPVNNGLLRVWGESNKPTSYRSQDGRIFVGDEATNAYLVLLVAPNQDFIRKIGEHHISNIILFQDIWNEFIEEFNFQKLMVNIQEDVKSVLDIFHEPTQGKRITRNFLSLRRQMKQ